MTREEAIRLIKDHVDTYIVCHGEEDTVAVSIDNVDVEAFDMAIKALEQEPILDKIRTEIAEHADRLKDSLYGDGMRHCIDIIDKYKAEVKPTGK